MSFVCPRELKSFAFLQLENVFVLGGTTTIFQNYPGLDNHTIQKTSCICMYYSMMLNSSSFWRFT